MAYQALYRKWRPLLFTDVVGQSHITDTLKTEIKNNKIAHAYLFCGTRGTGKTTTAKIFSRAINCETPLPNGDPCNKCSSCLSILNGSTMDVVEIDAASNNGVDNIRELREEIVYTPSSVKYRVYIIDEVHMLSTGAFNALLKTLEEPPKHAIFILATTEPHKLPATIKSRCQRFDFARITTGDIVKRLKEVTSGDGINITDDALRLVAQLGDGSMRDALSVLDLCSGIDGEITRDIIENLTGAISKKDLFDFALHIISGDFSKAVLILNNQINAGCEVSSVLDSLVEIFRTLLICKNVSNPEMILDYSAEDFETLKNIAKEVSLESLIHIIKLFSETITTCKWSSVPRIIFETAIAKACNPECDATTEAFAARLKRLEDRMKNVPNDGITNIARSLNLSDNKYDYSEINQNTAEQKTGTSPKQETHFEEELPPFEQEEPPFEMEPADISNTAEEPPFVLDDAKVNMVSEREEAVNVAKKEENSDINKEIEQPNINIDENFDWETIKSKIRKISPALFSYLMNTSATLNNNEVTILFKETLFRNNIRSDEYFLKLLKDILNGKSVILQCEDEIQKDSFLTENDPLEEIINKKSELGNQITLL